MVDLYGKFVGKYTSPMDRLGPRLQYVFLSCFCKPAIVTTNKEFVDGCMFFGCVCVCFSCCISELTTNFWKFGIPFLKIRGIFFTSQKRPPPGRTEILTTQCVVESEPPANVEDEEPESKKVPRNSSCWGAPWFWWWFSRWWQLKHF